MTTRNERRVGGETRGEEEKREIMMLTLMRTTVETDRQITTNNFNQVSIGHCIRS